MGSNNIYGGRIKQSGSVSIGKVNLDGGSMHSHLSEDKNNLEDDKEPSPTKY